MDPITKQKLYMFPDNNGGFYASTYIGGMSVNAQYFTKDGLKTIQPQIYRSLKSLAIAIRNAGFHGIDRTKPDQGDNESEGGITMEFYDSAKQSMDIESMLVRIMDEHSVSKTPEAAHMFKEPDENVYKITIEVTQVWPPL